MPTIISVLVLVLTMVGAPPPISISSQYKVGFAPASFPIQIRVEPHEDNRTLCWVYDGSDYSSSCYPWDGDKAPVFKTVWLKGLSAGDYEVCAFVLRVGNVSHKACLTVQVVAAAGPPDR